MVEHKTRGYGKYTIVSLNSDLNETLLNQNELKDLRDNLKDLLDNIESYIEEND